MLTAKLIVNGEELPIGEPTLSDIVYSLPDRVTSKSVIREIALEGGSQLLEHIAGRECLDERIVEILCRSKIAAVANSLLNSASARTFLRKDYVRGLIEQDNAEVLETLVENVEYLDCCSPEWVAARLAKHPDVRVRGAIAKSSATPKRYLRELARDSDLDIKHAAAATLEQKAVEEGSEDEDLLLGDDKL